MSDPRIEDHAVGVELQLTELVEQRERALVQGRHQRAERLQVEIDALQEELARTAERMGGSWARPEIRAHRATEEP
ncbi:MAG: hypothetical protein ACRDZ9_02645 [Acidimicrobiales bacterium]